MKLYFSPGACSLAPHIVLLASAQACTIERVDLRTKLTTSGDDYRAINPKGYVPALQLADGRLLTETQVILQYLADQVPGSGLAPAAGSFERYQLMEWLAYIATEMQKRFQPLFTPGTSEAAIPARGPRLPVRRRLHDRRRLSVRGAGLGRLRRLHAGRLAGAAGLPAAHRQPAGSARSAAQGRPGVTTYPGRFQAHGMPPPLAGRHARATMPA